jgi:hypothetical protein
VYWASSCYNTISAATLFGTQVTVLDTGMSSQIGAGGYGALARDDTTLFWAGDGVVKSMPLAGGPASIVSQVASGRVATIAADATRVYWTTPSGVFAAPRTGGPPLQLASVDTMPMGIHGIDGPGLALDDTQLYFSTGCDPGSTSKPAPLGPATR